MAEKPTKDIVGQTLDKPIQLNSVLIDNDSLRIVRKVYPLEKDEFLILSKPNVGWRDWQNKFLYGAFGAFLLIAAKAVEFAINLNDPEKLKLLSMNFKMYEVYLALFMLAATLGCLILSRYDKSEADELSDKIKNFLKQS